MNFIEFYQNFNIQIFLRIVLIRIPAVLISLGLHEWFHSWIAIKLGDDTSIKLKRNTMNPLKHIDPIGLLVFFIYGFGWSRPIPVNYIKLKNSFWDNFVISICAPIFNLFLAVITGFTFYSFGLHKYSYFFNEDVTQHLFIIMYLSDLMGYFMLTNFTIFIVNFIPIMPLDLSKLWMSFYISKDIKSLAKYQVYGILILLLLIVFGILNKLLGNIIKDFSDIIIFLSSIIK